MCANDERFTDLIDAARVVLMDSAIRFLLSRIDPQAYRQLHDAILEALP